MPMLESVFGTAGRLPEMIVSGMTDLQIIEEALRGEGITREHIAARKEELLDCYIREMKRATSNGDHIIMAMPGALEVLQAVAEHSRYRSALLTGNIEPAAYLKVEITGLAQFFKLPGAFGDESFDRRDLPAKAAQRINEHSASSPPRATIVIGDTLNDIARAKILRRAWSRWRRANSLAEDLQACNPDALFPTS